MGRRGAGPSAGVPPAPPSRGRPAEALSLLQQPRPRPPPPPPGGDLGAAAPGPPLTQVATPQPGRVLQPQGPFPHVPQQVWAGATPRHGSTGPGWEGSPPSGGGEGRDTRSAPEPRRHHPRAGPGGRAGAAAQTAAAAAPWAPKPGRARAGARLILCPDRPEHPENSDSPLPRPLRQEEAGAEAAATPPSRRSRRSRDRALLAR